MDEDRQREVADGRESVSLFNQGVHLGPQSSAGLTRAQMSTSIYVQGHPQSPPLDSCETSTSILTLCMPSRDPQHSAHHELSRSRALRQRRRAGAWWLVRVR